LQALKYRQRRKKLALVTSRKLIDCYGYDTLFYKGEEKGQEEKKNIISDNRGRPSER
jgi:hypothetical protein